MAVFVKSCVFRQNESSSIAPARGYTNKCDQILWKGLCGAWKKRVEVLVIGAGVSGLIAACKLSEAGRDVLVVDKGRSVGGRMATRRIGQGIADHGAQYFTARSQEFEQQIDRWIDEGLVYLWAMGFSTGSLTANDKSGHPRYAVRGGMNQLTKHMAHGLNVEVNVQIERITLADGLWRAESEDKRYIADALVLTPPVPQSLALLDAGDVKLADPDRAALDGISYAVHRGHVPSRAS
ncbi:MAG: FAD-dependent oxidoreductase [Caldilineaceae bacterium]